MRPISQLPQDVKDLVSKFESKTIDLMKDVAYRMLNKTQKKWEIRGGGSEFEGIQWPELSPMTVALRGSATPMLIQTGKMHAALDVDFNDTEARIFFRSPEDVKYAYHHEGSTKLPQRVLLDITEEDKELVEEMADKWAKKILEES